MLTPLGSGAICFAGAPDGVGLATSNTYPAYADAPESVPPGWLGPVAPTTQSCFFLDENGGETPGEWGRATNQGNAGPSGRLIFYTQTGGYLHTTGYAGGTVTVSAPGGPGAGSIRVRVTRVSKGTVLYDQTVTENQVGDKNYVLHQVALPLFAAWQLEIFQATPAAVNLTDVVWT